ncbi:Holliday junction resolvase RuvX [Thiohalobacter sp. IOR34]|uniref:Holliday junction resolvase RuvX n=1 Tax=Thiohalobacter sp. IOR34 TaxID=3057176 RepID=UPI0025B11493|nr:Holliday junction resolvase RuvX [Thiohalobacter sp. IOR34]WJW75784.1 Holliday junction resolvase RuvX [Thiohalobacter sp. IOR34]
MPEAATETLTLLGFDHGRTRIGVAVGSTLTGSARALTTLPAREGQPDWETVSQLIAEWQPALLVVGRPRRLDGSDSESTVAAERFARRLEGRYHLPVRRMDEQLSSHEAEALLGAEARRDPARIDAEAARIILQNWLDGQGD